MVRRQAIRAPQRAHQEHAVALLVRADFVPLFGELVYRLLELLRVQRHVPPAVDANYANPFLLLVHRASLVDRWWSSKVLMPPNRVLFLVDGLVVRGFAVVDEPSRNRVRVVVTLAPREDIAPAVLR